MSKENKDLIRRYVEECICKNDRSLLDELLAANYVWHTPTLGDLDLQAYKQFQPSVLAAFPDGHWAIENMISAATGATSIRMPTPWFLTAFSLGKESSCRFPRPIPPTSCSLLFAGTSVCDGTSPARPHPNQQNLDCSVAAGSYEYPQIGVLVGTPSELTQLQGSVQWSKSGTNPKGQILAQVVSYYLANGNLDTKPHTSVLKSNAISTFAVTNNTSTNSWAQFTSKASIYE